MKFSSRPRVRGLRGAHVLGLAAAACIGMQGSAIATGLDRETPDRPSLNFYGATGLIDMPTAQSQPDGELSTTTSFFGGISRNTLTFQITPRLSGSFRYAITNDWNFGGFPTYYDRSFDLRWQFLDEGPWWPALAVGLQDFVGTGIYGGEYVVATRSFGDDVTVTAGIGWGRLGSYNSFGTPFAGNRPAFVPGSTGGDISVDQWFRGPAAFFGGVEWRPTDRLGFKLEYSSDAYQPETSRGVFTRESPWNLGVEYQVNDTLRIGGYYMYGSEVGLTAQFTFNPRRPQADGIRQPAPTPVALRPDPRQDPGLWTTEWAAEPTVRASLGERLRIALGREGQTLVAYDIGATETEVRIENGLYVTPAQAIGRTARVMAAVLPPSVETFRIVMTDAGMALSTTVIRRSDLEALEVEPNAAEALRSVVGIGEAAPTQSDDVVRALYPRLSWSLSPYARASYFDPRNPVLGEVGLRLRGDYEFAPGWIVAGSLAQRVAGNLDEARLSPSALPPVRTSFPLYEQNDGPVIENLTLSHYRSLGNDFYGRLTVGYFERMYAGASGEVLWRPVDSQLALGAEVNYARAREYDLRFGLRDYDVITGHVSAYYDFENGFHAQIDAGRYLAGDWGATLSLDREFENGWRVGAFATLTDVSAAEFGEGSFDKGIRLSIPVSWFTGQPNTRILSTTIRPIQRDGGARLNVDGRLYDRVRSGQEGRIDDQWARVWR